MELRQLECFVAVAEELHFGRAAARLCMTQPPLSRQIQLLEQSLGVTLLERSSRVVTLTSAGRNFLRDARHLLAYSVRAASTARRASGGEAGHITLGFTAVAAYRLVPDWVMKAGKVLPDVAIDLRERVSTDLGRLLVAGELDAILARHLPRQDGLAHHLIQREPMVVAVPRKSPLLAHKAMPLRALHRQPFVAYAPSEGKYFYDRIAAALTLAGVEPDYVQYAGQTHTLLGLVRAGLGAGLVPASARELRLDGVSFLPLAQNRLHAELYLAWRERHDNPALDAFIGRVAEIPPAPR
ncbi:LysR family transcriptional regulator [Bordetella genomosp. 9]|uniref:LysR family transcriptional regulator n=1 Tax=Bordetella genomosp. 9 TaxID=1416803 RepID=A0A261REA1_9BORD|nr:LysR family transcriptional regulator [Bordetella genomosp. 9]OZI23097.1 LysR family transcriptional regulator [Bordetella genomosp. 9]